MLNIKILCVGRLKEKFYIEAAKEYLKRLSAFCKIEVEEVAESKLASPLEKEAESLEAKIPPSSYVIALCIEGQETDSEGFAKILENCALSGNSKLCFLIGGSTGLHERVKNRADRRLSMSKMTFPHHLARVMLLEQIYRGFQISEGGKYHK